MLSTRRRSNPMSLTPLIALISVVSIMFGFAGNAYAASGETQGPAGVEVATSGLVASLPGPMGSVAPFALIRNGEGSFGSFSGESPQALTVDQATGDVYAIEPSAGKLWRFSSTGAPENFTAGPDAGTNSLTGLSFQGFPGLDQVAVDSSGGPAKGDIYVTESGQHRVKVFASTGEPLGTITGTATPAGGLGEDCGIAVDQSNGDVYIANRGYTIWRYSPSKSVVSETDYSGGIEVGIEPCQLAVANGSLYAKQWQEFPIAGAGPLDKFSTSAFPPEGIGYGSAELLDQNVTAVTADLSTGDVYADHGNKIAVFDPAGNSLYTFGSSTDFGSESAGVAVNDTGTSAYVADPFHHRIDVYGAPVAAPPTATTGEAGGFGHAKAVLNGHLDLNGGPEVTDCHFDWGTTNTYGNTAPCEQGNNYTGAADVSATVTGLEPGKTYHYRLVAAAVTNTGTGEDQTFETVRLPVIHTLTSTFGTSGSGDGQLSGNTGLALNQTSGDVYVADTSNHRIEKFDTNGTFISTFGWGVKDGKPEAQTCTNNCQTGIAGSGPGQLNTPKFIAIDNSGGPSNGDVYVGDTANNTVTKYDTNGNYISTNDGTSSGSAFGPLAGIAVSTKGDLWVYDENAEMREFAQNGTFTTEWNSGFGVTPAGIAIDSTDTLYVIRGNPAVERLSSTGSDLGNVSGYPSEPTFHGPTTGLAIDPTGGDLYVDDGGKLIRQYPNPATCVAHGNQGSEGCSTADAFGSSNLNVGGGVTVNATGRVYVSDPDSVKIFDRATPPDVTTGTATAPSPTSAVINGTVTPNGVPLTDCHFEYVSDAAFLATGFTDLSSGGSALCTPDPGSITPDLEDHHVTATITGLDPTIIYHFRLVAANAKTVIDGQETLIPGPALVETTGSYTRTTTTARLDSRLDPRGAATSYHFEYGDKGPCDTNPCTSTAPQPAGSGETYELVSQQITGLKANTTYHYRLVAENGIPAGAAYGQDATITTRASDAPLTHGHFPGPPDSDRAWEQVSMPDTSGNPVTGALPLSDNGERVAYTIEGGSPGSQYGSGIYSTKTVQYAERASNGWQNQSLYPMRSESAGDVWTAGYKFGSGGLYGLMDFKRDSTYAGTDEIWRMVPGAPAHRVLSISPEEFGLASSGFQFAVSADGSRVLMILFGDIDPEHPAAPGSQNLYDVTTGTPHMVGLLPDGSVPNCGTIHNYMPEQLPSTGLITPDGSYAFFFSPRPGANCADSEPALYVRDLVNSSTVEIAADARFIRSTAGAVFFTTTESLVGSDTGGNDIYRYTLNNGGLDCLTCSTPAAGVVIGATNGVPNLNVMTVSDDGSRVYFTANHRLVQGAASKGIYRLNVSTRHLVYVAPAEGATVAGNGLQGDALSPDGSVFVFVSNNPALDAVNGLQDASTYQFYRYDDNDRSLVCVSCPGDGSPPRGQAYLNNNDGVNSALTSDGDGYVFTTPTPLVPEDQNTAPANQNPESGDDVYEWRDGRLLLISDGQTRNSFPPAFSGMSPDGSNVFFLQAARLTPDTLNIQTHLFDARIGGGFQFPRSAESCSLEACQGTALPPPNDATPASLSFSGPGNTASKGSVPAGRCVAGKCVKSAPQKKRCAKGRVRVHGKCMKKRARKHAKRANHNRGGAK